MARPQHELAGMARAPRGSRRRWTGPLLLAVVAAAALLVTLLRLTPSAAQQTSDAGPEPVVATPVAAAPTAAAPTAAASEQPAPAEASRSPSSAASAPMTKPRPTATPTEPAPPTPRPGAPPASAGEFDLRGQVIKIGFPLKAQSRYTYRDTFLARRQGDPAHYNHVRGRPGREPLRAHDGTDLYARAGTPVVAPFDGMVIDPGSRWKPWLADRHGRTAAIRSLEPTSHGYYALLSHLEALYVEPGQRVHRGEVVGTVGDSGNADGGRPHLHFELRAPFLLAWQELGEERLIDAFNPFPSLRAADPNRRP